MVTCGGGCVQLHLSFLTCLVFLSAELNPAGKCSAGSVGQAPALLLDQETCIEGAVAL